MIANYHGKYVPLSVLREKTQASRTGANMLGLCEAAEQLGFRGQAVLLSLDTLMHDASLPCILHWNQRHFVVLHKAGKQKLYVADPAYGMLTFDKVEFIKNWMGGENLQDNPEGVALLLEPGTDFSEKDDDLVTDEKQVKASAPKKMFSYLLMHKKGLRQLVMGLFVAGMLQILPPFLTQSVVDVGINTANIHFIYLVLMAQGALLLGRLATDAIRGWILLDISTRITVSILMDMIIKLMRLPLSFFDSKRTGDILQRMSDNQRIESFLTNAVVNLLFSLSTLVVFSTLLAIFNINFFCIFLLASLLYTGWIILFLGKRRSLDYNRFEIASKEQSTAIQMVQGMPEIRLNGIEDPMRRRWENLQAKLLKLNRRILAINQVQQSGASFINEGKNLFITLTAADAVIHGSMTMGSMLAVQYIIGQLNSPVEQMLGFLQGWQNARMSMDRINEIHTLDEEEIEGRQLIRELPSIFSSQVMSGAAGSETISFHDVSFNYAGPGNAPVLKDINISIPIGKTTAIVGVSGSGKTTLLKLLLKFYEPKIGDIRVGHTSLGAISHKTWRRNCGAVMQESFIFSDTIARNIAMGADRINWDRLYQAIEIANIGDLIETLPLGVNTLIGPEGIGLSMGQKQRVLIARAVYRNPGFIFFDEATNSLDASNEAVILHKLDRFFKGRTVVVVAHRLSTVKNASQIIVLQKGTVVETGTHTQLIRQQGAYYQLVRDQLHLGTD
jgi:ATP-binding cassette subfamily B protein